MRKLGVGYANYFNQKYQRSGTLFQGRYKLILVKEDAHFIHLPYYIHFNPLDLAMLEWRKGEIREFLLKIFGGAENYQKQIENWLREMNLMQIKYLLLE